MRKLILNKYKDEFTDYQEYKELLLNFCTNDSPENNADLFAYFLQMSSLQYMEVSMNSFCERARHTDLSILQFNNLSKIIRLSKKYTLPISSIDIVYEDGEYSIGVLWNSSKLLMDLEIFNEDEITFIFNEKCNKEKTQIASFVCAENAEKLFQELQAH